MIQTAEASGAQQSHVGWIVGGTLLAVLAIFLIVFGVTAAVDVAFAKDVYGMYLNDRLHPERQQPFVSTPPEAHKNNRLDRKVVFTTLLRDGEACVGLMRARFATLFEMFRDCALVVYENDSVDGTRNALRAWSRQDPRVKVIGESTRSVPAESLPGGHASRIARMAQMRQMCLNHIRARHSDASYIVVFDADLDGAWDLDGLMDSFARLERGDVDVLAASGIGTAVPGVLGCVLPNFQHDVGAFLPLKNGASNLDDDTISWDTPQFKFIGFKRHLELTAGVAAAKVRGKLFPVSCAFSGLCIYRAKDWFAGSYIDDCKANCEHIELMRTMQRSRNRNGDGPLRVAINPKMQIFTGGNEINRLGERCKFYSSRNAKLFGRSSGDHDIRDRLLSDE